MVTIDQLGLKKIGEGTQDGTDNTSGKTKYQCQGCKVESYLSGHEVMGWVMRHQEQTGCRGGLE